MKSYRRRLGKLFDLESKTLLKNSSWVFFANTYGAGLAMLKSIVIARGLGADILGIYTVVIAFVITVQEVIKLNIGLGVIKFGAHYVSEDRKDKLIALLKGGILASMASALVSVFIISLLTHFTYKYFFDAPGLEKFIILYSIINGISFLDNIGRATLKIFYKFRINSIVQMIMDSIEFIAITICIFKFHDNLDYFFYTVIFAKLLNTTVCNLLVYLELRNELRPYFATTRAILKSEYIEIRHFIVGNSFGNTLKTLLNQGDVLLLNLWGTHSAVGLYSVSKKLAYAILTITDPLVTSIYPQLSHLVSQKKFHELKTMLVKITGIALIPATLFSLVVFFLKGEIITFIYGEEFRKATTTFFIHFIGAIQGSIFFWSLPLTQGLGLTNIRLKAYLIAIVVDVIIAMLFTPTYGGSGVALGLLTANLITTGYFIYYSQKKINSELRLTAV